MKTIVIDRGKVTFYVYDEQVIVSNGGFQYTSYSPYGAKKRDSFSKFKNGVLNSSQDSLCTIVDVMDLSSKCKIYGTSSKKPTLDEENCEYRP